MPSSTKTLTHLHDGPRLYTTHHTTLGGPRTQALHHTPHNPGWPTCMTDPGSTPHTTQPWVAHLHDGPRLYTTHTQPGVAHLHDGPRLYTTHHTTLGGPPA